MSNELSRFWRILLLLFTAGMTLFWNRAFIQAWPLPQMAKMNDVSSILSGYHHAQPLFPGSLHWWHGTWIREGVPAFRPLSSYLYWLDCWIGLHWGFLWTAWTGYLLFLAAALLSAILAWRLTGSVLCTFFGAALVSGTRFLNASQKDTWLAWFPVHHDLLMVALLLAALLCFDSWFAGGERRWLGWSWLFFAAGCLAKEYVYVFPLFTATVSLLRRPGPDMTRQRGLGQSSLMLAAVLALWRYRAAVVPHPRDNAWGIIQLVRAPLLYLYSPLERYLLVMPWVVGLAALLLLLAGLVVVYRRSLFRETRGGRLLGRPMVWLPGLLIVLALYFACATDLGMSAPWFFLDGESGLAHSDNLVTIAFMLYTIFLIWKYRRSESSVAAWVFLVLSCIPVLGFFGWHYDLPMMFLRAPYNALMLKLVWVEWGRPGLVWMSAGQWKATFPILSRISQ